MAMGRPKGSKNKMSKTVKETIEKHFHRKNLNGAALDDLYGESVTAYFQLVGRLVPAEIKADVMHHVIDLGQAMNDAQARLTTSQPDMIDVTPNTANPLISKDTNNDE